MKQQLPIWWAAWWLGTILLALGLVAMNVARRRRLARSADVSMQAALPTLREDVLWGALVLLGGGGGLGIILWLLLGAHTARSLLAAIVFGLMMLLGLAMLLKNGLAPTDVLQLDGEPEEATAAESLPEGSQPPDVRWRIGPGM